MKFIRSCATALLCACLLSGTAYAEGTTPTLSKDCETSAVTKIYSYVPLAVNTGFTKSDEVYCMVTERIYDNSGNVYILSDSAPFSDSSLFRKKTTVTVGANYVRKVTPAEYSKDGFSGSSFRIALDRSYSGQHAVIGFENRYTALSDVVLQVFPANGGQEIGLLMKAGTEFTSVSKLVLSEKATLVTAYPDELPPYESKRATST